MKVACTVLEGLEVGNDLRLLNTTTKISAGMAYLSHGVIAAGRFHYQFNKNLGQKKLSKLKRNIVLLNKVGKLLKSEPTLGRVFAMKKHIYVGGLNVHKMVEDVGYLILKKYLEQVCRLMKYVKLLRGQII